MNVLIQCASYVKKITLWLVRGVTRIPTTCVMQCKTKFTVVTCYRDVSFGRERNPIGCVNAVDDDPHPTDYLYVNHNVETQDLHINNVITSLQVTTPTWPEVLCAVVVVVKVISRGFLVGHTLVLDCSTTSCSFECRRSGYWFVSYLWLYTFRDADFPLFSVFFPLFLALFHFSLSELSLSFCVHFLWDSTHM